MRELKHLNAVDPGEGLRRTPPGVRELKLSMHERFKELHGRTPPGVRELKLHLRRKQLILHSRTPPGVRELKQPKDG